MSLPVFVLSSAGGAARDLALRQLVRGHDPGRVTAIVPGRGRRARGRDGVTRVSTQERLERLGKGCGCCTVRGDLLPRVRDIARSGKTDHLVVHVHPQGDLKVLAKTFTVADADGSVLGDEAHVDTLIVVASVDELLRRGSGCRQLVERIELAQVVLLDTHGGDHPDAVLEAELVVRALQPKAQVMALDAEQATLAGLGGGSAFDLDAAQRRAELQPVLDRVLRDDGRIRRFAFGARRPFHPERLHAWLAESRPRLLRARGTFWVASRPHLAATLDLARGDHRTQVFGHWWAAVPQVHRPAGADFQAYLAEIWDPIFGDRRQELAFVGVDLDQAELTRSLRACLLDDDELAEPERWATSSHPFAWGQEQA